MIMAFVLCAIGSYLIGGVNGAIILSKLVYKQDIRNYGSKNPGFTNFKRVYGNGFVSWSVMIIDILKTVLPVLASAVVFHCLFDMWQLASAFSGFFCMLGHCFPVWYKFKGGKAFIAGFATTWFVDWRMGLVFLGVFLIMLGLFKYMSLASCTAALSSPITLLILGASSVWVTAICAVSSLLIIARHYQNFIKLAKGTESKFSLKSQKA